MDLKLYQIWYRDEQKPHLDVQLLPWDNRANERPEWCEYWTMRQAGLNFDQHFGDLTGFFSWKYQQKLDIEFNQIQAYIAAYPHYDCYIFSTSVFQVAFYLNVWQQGETFHPGITQKAQNILAGMGIRTNLEYSVDNHLTTAFANYWIANKPFWQGYLAFMDGVFNYIENALHHDEHGLWRFVHASHGGDDQSLQQLPVIPYIVERMFSVYVKLNPQFKVKTWELPLESMKKRADAAAGLVPVANWLKYMYSETKNTKYLTLYAEIQQEMMDSVGIGVKMS